MNNTCDYVYKMAICFSAKGREVIERINRAAAGAGIGQVRPYVCMNTEGPDNDRDTDPDGIPDGFERISLETFVNIGFDKRCPLIFVGAAGIAVRAISRRITSKFSDSPVIVVDDNGQFVIPILSGHAGGANKLASVIAKLIGAVNVITTSTDVNGAFSADVFANENHLKVRNREGIRKVSAKAIEGKPVTISVKDYPPADPVDITIADETDSEYELLLSPKRYTLGIGMKKDKDPKEAEGFLLSFLTENSIDTDDIYAVCTADIKENEPAIRDFCNKYRIPLITFEPSVLSRAKGDFTSSRFVKDTVGVDNVCERAAVLGAGPQACLTCKKTKGEGITAAIAQRNISRRIQSRISQSQGNVAKDHSKRCGKIYVVGLGPGDISMMTVQAKEAIENSDVIIGYRVYTDLISSLCEGKQVIESGMREEISRCQKCVELARGGSTVALVCSGDAGVYGMASPLLEIAAKEGFGEVSIIPGVTAALSGAAVLGAPIGHDFCVVSLSDLLTPWELIENRIRLAVQADLCIVIYNPSSHKRADNLRKACEIMLTILPPHHPCGYVRNIGRSDTDMTVCTLKELSEAAVDMFTTVFIGNTQTRIEDGRLITPRGYRKK